MLLRNGFPGGPHPVSSHPPGQVDLYNMAQTPGSAGFMYGDNIAQNIAQAWQFISGPYPGSNTGGALKGAFNHAVPENMAQQYLSVVPDVIVATMSRDDDIVAVRAVLEQVFGYADTALLSDDLRGIMRSAWYIKVPQLERATSWTNPSSTPFFEQRTTVSEVLPFAKDIPMNVYIGNTEIGRALQAGVGVAFGRLVLEKALLLAYGLMVSNQTVPRAFNKPTGQVSFPDAFKVIISGMGVANMRNINCVPFLAVHARTAATETRMKPPVAVIMDPITRMAIHTMSADNFRQISGNVAETWTDGELGRGKAPASGLTLYKFPLVDEETSTVSAIHQHAIVWHYAVFTPNTPADPIASFRRVWTGTDTATSMEVSELVQNLCCFDGEDHQGYLKVITAADEANMNADSAPTHGMPANWRVNNSLMTERGNNCLAFGDVQKKFFSNEELSVTVGNFVDRMRMADLEFSRALATLSNYVAKCDSSPINVLVDARSEQAFGAGVSGALRGPKSLVSLKNGLYRSDHRGKIALTSADANDTAVTGQWDGFKATPTGLASFSGCTAYVGMHERSVTGGAVIAGTAADPALFNALVTFGRACEHINSALGNPITDDMDPTGNNDYRNVFFFLLVATNHTPLYALTTRADIRTTPGSDASAVAAFGAKNEVKIVGPGVTALLADIAAAGLREMFVPGNPTADATHITVLEDTFSTNAQFVGAQRVTGGNHAITPRHLRSTMMGLAYGLLPASRKPQWFTSINVRDFKATLADLAKFDADFMAVGEDLYKILLENKVEEARRREFVRRTKELKNSFETQLMANAVPTLSYADTDTAPKAAAPSGFVISWSRVRELISGTDENRFRPADRLDHSVASVVIDAVVNRTMYEAMQALFNSICLHPRYKDPAGALIAAPTLATLDSPDHSQPAANTDMAHRIPLIMSTVDGALRLAIFAYLFVPVTGKSLFMLQSSRIGLPWLVGAFFPVHYHGLPIIFTSLGFSVYSTVTNAHLLIHDDIKTQTASIRALYTINKEYDAAATFVNLAHITHCGPADSPLPCQKDFVDRSIDQESSLGYIPFLTRRAGLVTQAFMGLRGIFEYPGSVNPSFKENNVLHYDMAPWVNVYFELWRHLSMEGQTGFFPDHPQNLNHVTAAVPCSYTFITASGQPDKRPVEYTHGAIPVMDGALATGFFGYRPIAVPIGA